MLRKHLKNSPIWIILAIQLVMAFVIFGQKIFNPSDYLYTVDYDGLKNYFNYLFYTTCQNSENLLAYKGMSYPFYDHILYADTTTVLALLVKVLGIKEHSLAVYNLFFLLTFLLAPLVAFNIGRHLNFKLFLNITFSLFIVWVHPMILRWGEWSNLSLSIIYLLAVLVLIKSFAHKNSKSQLAIIHLSLFFLIVISSFIHLYYLIILGIFLGFAYLIGFFIVDKKQSLLFLLNLLLAAVTVFAIVYLSDDLISQRPPKGMGFDNPGNSCDWWDYLNSYSFLSFPSIFNLTWNESSPKFLGSAFPLTILAIVIFSFFGKKGERFILHSGKTKYLIHLILWPTLICFFTSLGFKIYLTNSVKIYNFFNPMSILAMLSESFEHFRYLSRFGHIAFTGITIVTCYGLNEIIKRFSIQKPIAWLAYCAMIIMLFDVFESSTNMSTLFDHNNIFSEKYLDESLPEFDNYTFDAILPIPYYHVGSENWNYTIDDQNPWSRLTYMMSIKYQIPLMSQKSARASVINTKHLFSLFTDQPSEEIVNKLEGKNILLCVSQKYHAHDTEHEPARTLNQQALSYIEKWQAEFIINYNEVDYYLVEF